MTNNEAIEVLKIKRECFDFEGFSCKMPYLGTEIGCNTCAEAVDMAIEALKKQSELAKGIEDLRDTLNDAYILNDFVLSKILIGKPLTEAEDIAEMFSIKAMQNLS